MLNRMNMRKSRSDLQMKTMFLSLLQNGAIKTTSGRAKQLKRFADREIGYAVRLDGNALKNRLASRAGVGTPTQSLLNVREFYQQKEKTPVSGYVSIVKVGFRGGDNAEMSEISLIDREPYLSFVQAKVKKASKAKKPKKPSRQPVTPAKTKVKEQETQSAKKGATAVEKKAQPAAKPPKKAQPKSQATSVKPEEKTPPAAPERQNFLDQIRGRILGRKVRPGMPGRKGRSTARSGI